MEKEDIIKLLSTTTNVYTDESSHMDDGSKIMVLGATWMNSDIVKEFADKIKLIKSRHDIPRKREIKWTKVGTKKIDYYKDLIDLFVVTEGLNFRAVVVDKTVLELEKHGKTRDDFYYIMQYLLIRNIAEKCFGKIKIYLDYKDTWSGKKSIELADYLLHTKKIHSQGISAQPIRSYESTALQLADLMTGAVMFANKERDKADSKAKLELVQHIENRIGQSLAEGTPYNVEKFNLLFWGPREE